MRTAPGGNGKGVGFAPAVARGELVDFAEKGALGAVELIEGEGFEVHGGVDRVSAMRALRVDAEGDEWVEILHRGGERIESGGGKRLKD